MCTNAGVYLRRAFACYVRMCVFDCVCVYLRSVRLYAVCSVCVYVGKCVYMICASVCACTDVYVHGFYFTPKVAPTLTEFSAVVLIIGYCV